MRDETPKKMGYASQKRTPGFALKFDETVVIEFIL
jgi:hypothetical protein